MSPRLDIALVLSIETTSSQDKEMIIELAVGDGPTIANADSVLVNIVIYSVQSTTIHVAVSFDLFTCIGN